MSPRQLRALLPELARARAPACLAAIVLSAASLSTYWAFLIPIFQAPDEHTHIDYAFDIYSAGRLIRARDPPQNWTHSHSGWRANVHEYTWLLIQESDFERIAFHRAEKARASYGSAQFFDQVDRTAAAGVADEGDASLGKPITELVRIYPFGYYAALALWMRFLSLFTSRLSVLFFGARMFSVLLLICSLLLVYGVVRELRLSRGWALTFTAIIGFFPMTSYVSSYVQPDNLGLTLVLLSTYLALLVRRKQQGPLLAMLGIALGLLCVTKHHFFIATFLAILAMLVSGRLAGRMANFSWFRLLAPLVIPSCVFLAVQCWISWDQSTLSLFSDPNLDHAEASEAASRGAVALLTFFVKGAWRGFKNFYITGTTFHSFWGTFGWLDTPLIIFSPSATTKIRPIIKALNCLVFALALFRIAQIGRRLALLSRRGRWRRALEIACANPLLNGYFLFTILMFALYMVVREGWGPQGRNWFPFLLPIFLVATHYAPAVVPHRRTRVIFARVLAAGLLAYCAIGSYYSIECLKQRYY